MLPLWEDRGAFEDAWFETAGGARALEGVSGRDIAFSCFAVPDGEQWAAWVLDGSFRRRDLGAFGSRDAAMDACADAAEAAGLIGRPDAELTRLATSLAALAPERREEVSARVRKIIASRGAAGVPSPRLGRGFGEVTLNE